MMKKVLIIVAAVLIFIACDNKQEPTFRNRPMSFWLKSLSDSSSDTREEAAEALRIIGEPAIKPLMKIIKK